MRYRFTLWDSAVIAGAAILLLLLGLEYDLLLGYGFSESAASQIELAEALLIGVTLSAFLFVAVRRARAQSREVQRRIAAERRARELAFQDPLTGLPNRRKLDEAVAAAVAAPPGADRAHAVLMLDLNGFKSVNDVFGHPTGDAVLREVACRLTSVVRETGDEVARLGGDEFGIVATQLRGVEDANGIGRRVIEALSSPVRSDHGDHTVGVGIGVALFPQDGRTAEELVRRADVALYRAKAEPQSRLCFFEEQMDAQIRERALIEGELRRAVAACNIEPHYQPIVDLRTGEITGFEALARWNHETLGEVPPERFLPVAEDCGVIRELSDHLLRTACREAGRWPARTSLSFNVSPALLRDLTFGLRVLAILAETGLTPGRLEIEITESTLVRDLKVAEASLGSLRAAGVRIALDDFGTGYSSLYHLRRFKIDRIKIDRSFVESMSQERESATIVRGLLGLGHGLGLQITAEGIESAEQSEALKVEGCDQGQGFLFSRALPAREAEALVCPSPARALLAPRPRSS